MQYAGVAETIGVQVDKLDEVVDIWPLAVTDGLIGASPSPLGWLYQPADLTQLWPRAHVIMGQRFTGTPL